MNETLVQRIELGGESYVVVRERDYRSLVESSGGAMAAPQPLSNGNYDATEVLRYEMAQKIISARKSAGWSQAELARRSKVRVETINRIEKAKVAAEESTILKIEKALKKVSVRI